MHPRAKWSLEDHDQPDGNNEEAISLVYPRLGFRTIAGDEWLAKDKLFFNPLVQPRRGPSGCVA